MKTSFRFISVLFICASVACSTVVEPNNIADGTDRQRVIDILKSKRWEHIAVYDPGTPERDTLQIPKDSRNELEFVDNTRVRETSKQYGSQYGYWRIERNVDYADTVQIRWRLITTDKPGSTEVTKYILFLSSSQLIMTGEGGRHGREIDFFKPM
jgi:hypothetical protein